ncbi:hypothetical protein A2Z22_03525 [Candidatus Woesebacteria bacterium RBG_16_34_12]|uniref:Uncharacterized protein n=1 Tax=Candidatus Woesebacteria bacterium RBG_16_34_12 TaxID=1802480 RepID=A0A1F7XAT5_9BACT|nr:MAG: hypothetical protein A2Z22_03525 [Candidatus Woesebacteria bacterium RBG_16_34_12]
MSKGKEIVSDERSYVVLKQPSGVLVYCAEESVDPDDTRERFAPGLTAEQAAEITAKQPLGPLLNAVIEESTLPNGNLRTTALLARMAVIAKARDKYGLG